LPQLAGWLAAGDVVICDRYRASSVAYGEAQGLDAAWLLDIQRGLPTPDLTLFLDIAPDTAVMRKAKGRDRYERDLELLSRVRTSYRRQAADDGWVLIDGEAPKPDVARAVDAAVSPRLAPPSAPVRP
jgi:dTMP kinase